jgi:hypothetical protein
LCMLFVSHEVTVSSYACGTSMDRYRGTHSETEGQPEDRIPKQTKAGKRKRPNKRATTLVQTFLGTRQLKATPVALPE